MLAHAEVGGSAFSVDSPTIISRSIPVYWTRGLMYLECQIRISDDNDIWYIKTSLDSLTSIPSVISRMRKMLRYQGNNWRITKVLKGPRTKRKNKDQEIRISLVKLSRLTINLILPYKKISHSWNEIFK